MFLPMSRTALVRLGVLSAILLALVFFLLGGDSGPDIEPGSTVVVEIGGGYVEGPAVPLLAQLLGGVRRPFAGLLSTFAMLERDDRVATVVLHVKGLEIGWGKAQEIRGAIGRLNDAGRKTIAFLEVASFSPNLEYFVASAADEFHVPPGAALPMVGLAAEYLYLGGLLEKVGIEVAVSKVGRFKAAPESIAEKQMSEPARLQANALLDSTFEHFNNNTAERAIRHLAIQRKISGSFYERVALQYLRLLGIAQTCRFQNKSFLRFMLSGEKDIDRYKERKRRKSSRRITKSHEQEPSSDQ